jgi:hypothetical protein
MDAIRSMAGAAENSGDEVTVETPLLHSKGMAQLAGWPVGGTLPTCKSWNEGMGNQPGSLYQLSGIPTHLLDFVRMP